MHSFILRTPRRELSARGIRSRWSDASAANQALRRGQGPVVGALPFHADDPAVLFTPETLGTDAPDLPRAPLPGFLAAEKLPTEHDHAERVREAIRRIREGDFDKIVLSRQVRYLFDDAVDPEVLLRRFLENSPGGNGHLVDLSPAGPTHRGATLVGSTPELLISRRGRSIISHPLAGTVPRAADPEEDRARAAELLGSAKDAEEHAYVTGEINRILAPLCTDLHIPVGPSLTRSTHTWHLGTRITGTLADQDITALELASALHPTPAIGGHPTPTTQAVLREVEPDRGFYAGAVGWTEESGDGDWWVTIRSAVVQGRTVSAHAGGGIVAASDPDAEVRETNAKLGPVQQALGLPTVAAARTPEPARR